MEESEEKLNGDDLAQDIKGIVADGKEKAKEAEKKHRQDVEEQKAIREKIRMMIVDREPVKEVKEYFDNSSASKETLQQALLEGIKELIDRGWNIQLYLPLADEQILQQVLLEGILKLIEKGVDIQKYLSLVDEQTIASLENSQELQESLFSIIVAKIKRGYAYAYPLQKYIKLISSETIQRLENEEFVKQALQEAVGNFFNDANPLSSEIQEAVEELSHEERLKALYDKTLLPIGFKIHTEDNPILYQVLYTTGGFIASGQEQCYVANPVANADIVELALKALKKKLTKPLKEELVNQLNELKKQVSPENKEEEEKEKIKAIEEKLKKIESGEYNPFPEKTYFQVCIPHRLDNEACGIATIVFLLTRERNLIYTPELIKHNQYTNGVTIYDAGGVIVGQHFVPTKDGKGATPLF